MKFIFSLLLVMSVSLSALSTQFSLTLSAGRTLKYLGETEKEWYFLQYDNPTSAGNRIYWINAVNKTDKTIREFQLWNNNTFVKGEMVMCVQADLTSSGIISVVKRDIVETKERYIRLFKHDVVTGQITDSIAIQDKFHKQKEGYRSYIYQYLYSADKSKIAIITLMDYEKDLNEMIKVDVLSSENLDPIYSYEMALSCPSPKSYLSDFELLNDGTFFIKKYDRENSKPIVAIASQDNWKEAFPNRTDDIFGNFYLDKNGNYEFIGFGLANSHVQSIVQITFDKKSKSILSEKNINFHDGILREKLSATDIDFKETKGINWLEVDPVQVIKNDITGGYYLIANRSHDGKTNVGTPEKPVYNYSYSTDQLLITSLDSDLNPKWSTFMRIKHAMNGMTDPENKYQGYIYYVNQRGDLSWFHGQAQPLQKINSSTDIPLNDAIGNSYGVFHQTALAESGQLVPADYQQGTQVKFNPSVGSSYRLLNIGYYPTASKQMLLMFQIPGSSSYNCYLHDCNF
jgi:hypothetical protein